MARNRAGRGIGFVVLIALVVYGVMAGAIALKDGRVCSDQGLEREWQWMPPAWNCRATGFVNLP